MLVVGRQIVLKGEINSCDRLIVEGKVEAIMKDCREIEIADTGTFKGQVEFDRADIGGVFEGELTAREHLVVRATGRVTARSGSASSRSSAVARSSAKARRRGGMPKSPSTSRPSNPPHGWFVVIYRL